MQNLWQCRWSPTLGALEDTHQNIWGTCEYTNPHRPTVFFGLYGLPDFWALWRHRGRRAILWAGTDILHFENGYWLDEVGSIKVSPKPLATWINKFCENWCENEVEWLKLKKLGIKAEICPSFLGDVKQFAVSFRPGNKVYTSVSGDNFEQYGWHLIEDLAFNNPEVEFHLYGNIGPFVWGRWPNIFVHARVPKEQMNEEIKGMQGALRLTKFDGFSEILAKSVLMGQWPISLIKYPGMLSLDQLGEIVDKTEANLEGREHYLRTLNKYPWNSKL